MQAEAYDKKAPADTLKHIFASYLALLVHMRSILIQKELIVGRYLAM